MHQSIKLILFISSLFLISKAYALKENTEHFRHVIRSNIFGSSDPESAVLNLISRVIDNAHNINDFVIRFDKTLNGQNLDTFQLEMDKTGDKLVITANSIIAATWGFNYYLKYYTNSSLFWSGKNIRLNASSLPKVDQKITITAKDYVRFYQNVCTYSYSFVWWDWERWQYEIDWMALNGINMAYAHTAAEYVWNLVYKDFGLTENEINSFFTGPAYLAWQVIWMFRMGNIKHYGGGLKPAWHEDQTNLQKQILNRFTELGINYVLPAFAGFVPDSFERLYPNKNFSVSYSWNLFTCNDSCVLLVDPLDKLFEQLGSAYIQKITSIFGTSHLYSADVFNEMDPKSSDLTYLSQINAAIYNSMTKADPNAIWVMQAWLFLSSYWTPVKVHAFLSLVPKGRLILLDLFSESQPQYQKYSSYYGHLFVWNMLHNFGGANQIFGQIESINSGPDAGRSFPNSTMVGLGITMEGINQNEIIYDFMLEKSWRPAFHDSEMSLTDWIAYYTLRRYTAPPTSNLQTQFAWLYLASSVYDDPNYGHDRRQLFTRRPSLSLQLDTESYLDTVYIAWIMMVSEVENYRQSDLFRYDIVDITKEILRYEFSKRYSLLLIGYNNKNLYLFTEAASEMREILEDIDRLLGSDRRFLLGNWIEAAKLKGTTKPERDYYQWNARAQITLWGDNSTYTLFDYACKAWSGLIADYYLQRWNVFFKLVEESILEGTPIDENKLNKKLLLDAEIPFITSKNIYPNYTEGDSIDIVLEIYKKYF